MSDHEGTVESRLRRLEDLQEIHELFLAYRRALDEKDFAGYVQLFAEQGEFIAGEWRAQGREQIRALVDGMLGSLLTERPGGDLHVVANPAIVLEGDRARASSTWIYILRDEQGGPSLCKVGHYDDLLVREHGHWRFQRRDAPTDMPA